MRQLCWPWIMVVAVMVGVGVGMGIGVDGRGRLHHGAGREGQRRGEDRQWRELRTLLLKFRELSRVAEKKIDDYDYENETAAREWMKQTNQQLLNYGHQVALANWEFTTNINNDTQQKYISKIGEQAEWEGPRRDTGRKFHVQDFDSDLQRQFYIFTLSSDPRDPDKARKITQIRTAMESVYDKATVCLSNVDYDDEGDLLYNYGGCLPLEPHLENMMATSRESEELLEVWEGWREKAGKPQRERYAEFVHLLNEGARENGFKDYGDYWAEDQFMDHSDTDLEAMVTALWKELRPLYLQLHAYVRGRLREHYGDDMEPDGTIPAHLLGNMWAQNWVNIFPLVAPFPDLMNQSAEEDDSSLNELLKTKYKDVRGLFKLSEDFYVSMGLPKMTQKFWEKSMLERPRDQDREVQCHASAFDLVSEGDFRIKMCTQMTMEDLKTIHHEMGHVHYYMAYENQPTVYRDSANQAFHEAVGDTAALSVMSRTHLKKLGLAGGGNRSYGDGDGSEGGKNVTNEDINALMKMALAKVAFLPFAFAVDKWRWQVFRNETTPDTYNYDWWKLRLDLQGLRSPVPRSEEDFDVAAKMHVPGNDPYYCYFVSFVVQFQFYQTLCQASNHTGHLHLCDFGGSKEAGKRFREFMALGASKPWQEALETLTGSRNISAKPMLQYFAPLQQWLTKQNEQSNEKLGWGNATVNWQKP